MPKAGNFEIEVTGPHPCWLRLAYEGRTLLTIRHNEIRDLEFVIDRAKAEAKRRLGNDADEIS